MTIEEIIKEAFSQGWNASHECATDFDYEYALKNCLSDLESEVKKLNIPDVVGRSEQLCECDAPLIRTSDKGGEYCGLCQNDLD